MMNLYYHKDKLKNVYVIVKQSMMSIKMINVKNVIKLANKVVKIKNHVVQKINFMTLLLKNVKNVMLLVLMDV